MSDTEFCCHRFRCDERMDCFNSFSEREVSRSQLTIALEYWHEGEDESKGCSIFCLPAIAGFHRWLCGFARGDGAQDKAVCP